MFDAFPPSDRIEGNTADSLRKDKVMEQKNILEFETLALDDAEDALCILDQTKLPGRAEMISLKTQEEIWHAIHELQVRGAPAIGDAAAIGI